MSTRFRTTALRWALPAAPLLILVGFALHPEDVGGDPRRQMEVIEAASARWLWSHVFVFASSILFVPATIQLVRTLGARAARTADVATAFLFIGIPALAAGAVIDLIKREAATIADRDAATTLLERLPPEGGGPWIGLVLLPSSLFLVGLVIFGIVLYRTRTAPAWAGVAIALGALGWMVGIAAHKAILLGAVALLTAGAAGAVPRQHVAERQPGLDPTAARPGG